MWRSKKLIIATLLATVLLVGSAGGIVLANGTENGEHGKRGACREAVLAEACEILNAEWGCSDITAADLKDVLMQARQAVGDECQRPFKALRRSHPWGGPRGWHWPRPPRLAD